jgi:hypothetical protein
MMLLSSQGIPLPLPDYFVGDTGTTIWQNVGNGDDAKWEVDAAYTQGLGIVFNQDDVHQSFMAAVEKLKHEVAISVIDQPKLDPATGRTPMPTGKGIFVMKQTPAVMGLKVKALAFDNLHLQCSMHP